MTNILLVEDDSAIIENLSAVLKAEGFQVRAEAGQREALEALQEEKFDLLLLDVSLQNGNGFAVCSAVKAESDTPVIFLTASGDEDTANRGNRRPEGGYGAGIGDKGQRRLLPVGAGVPAAVILSEP